jgi:hypothetical protein
MKPTSAAPERILAFGSPGSGKSKGWGDTAQMYRTTQTPGHFHVLSTEPGTMERMRDAYPATDTDPGWDQNITVHQARDWQQLEAVTSAFVDTLTSDDWCVVEELGKPWEWVRNYYDQTRPNYKPRGSGTDPFALEVEVQRNWDSIKSVYYAWLNSLIMSPAHVYCVAHEDALRVEGGWKDSDEAIAMYKYIGVRAVTEKTAAYSLHSVLWMRRTGARQWVIKTVDDHARDYLDDTPVTSFPMTYLLGPGGWSL